MFLDRSVLGSVGEEGTTENTESTEGKAGEDRPCLSVLTNWRAFSTRRDVSGLGFLVLYFVFFSVSFVALVVGMYRWFR